MLSNAEKILALMDRDRGAADGEFARGLTASAHVEEDEEWPEEWAPSETGLKPIHVALRSPRMGKAERLANDPANQIKTQSQEQVPGEPAAQPQFVPRQQMWAEREPEQANDNTWETLVNAADKEQERHAQEEKKNGNAGGDSEGSSAADNVHAESQTHIHERDVSGKLSCDEGARELTPEGRLEVDTDSAWISDENRTQTAAERADARAAFECKGAHQRAALATGRLAGYLDSGASHHQMKPAAMRELGQGVTRAANTSIYGVNEHAPLKSTHKGEALWPFAHVSDGTTHAVKLNGVLAGGDVSGPALLSVGRMTEQGYWFLMGGKGDHCWIFDESMTLVKAVKQRDYVYPVNASDHDQVGAGSSIAQDTIEKMLAMQEALQAEEEGKSADAAIARFGTSYTNNDDHAFTAHVRYGHSAVIHGPLKKHLEEATGKTMSGAHTGDRTCICKVCMRTRTHKYAKPTNTQHRRPADNFMDRWHIDGKVMFGRPHLLVLDEALSVGWALLGTDRKDLLVEYMALKRREEVRTRKRLNSIEILEGNLHELRSDGAGVRQQGNATHGQGRWDRTGGTSGA